MNFNNGNSFSTKNLNVVKINERNNNFKLKPNNVEYNKINTIEFDKVTKKEFVLNNNRNEVEDYDLSVYISEKNKNSNQTTNFVHINTMDTFIEINSFTDKQNSLIVQLAYLNFDIDGVEKYIEENGSISLSHLRNFLLDANSPYLGSLAEIGGIKTTNSELLDELEKNNLGNLQIVKIFDDNKSSLNAIVFEDSKGNRGFTFRGTDVTTANDLLKDGIIDIVEGVSDYNVQVPVANNIFNEYKSNVGKNYLFGHSLGGNIVYHMTLDNIDNIEKSFIINGTPLGEENSKKLENKNVIGKITSVIIEGDSISKIKNVGVVDGVNYIVVRSNNDYLIDHVVESATYDENGNFIISDKTVEQEMKNIWKPVRFVNYVRRISLNTYNNLSNGWHKATNYVEKTWKKITDFFS